MFVALRDCVPALKWCRHQDSPDTLLRMFEQEVERSAVASCLPVAVLPHTVDPMAVWVIRVECEAMCPLRWTKSSAPVAFS